MPALPMRRVGAVLLAAVLAVTSLLLATSSPASADDPPPTLAPLDRPLGGEAGAPAPVAVTLITGDRVFVTLDAAGSPSAVVESEADHYSRRIGDDLYVIPATAEAALAADRLDLELFNVTGLVEQGYDDASRDTLPVIIDGRVPTTRGAGGAITAEADLDSIDATAATIDKDQAADAFADLVGTSTRRAAPVEKVWLDGMVQPMADLDPRTGVEQTGAPDAWDLGFDGAGTTVAVLDTGYDADHPDLVDQVVATADFTGLGMADSTGHGTHVASTVAGSGAADPSMVGMAPATDLLIGHVLGPFGGQTSWIVDGMEWAVGEGVDVVNMSLGSATPTNCTDPLSSATRQLIEQSDTLFVIAAGNNGARETVTSPGCVEAALTVGAVDAAGATADFSSRGATADDRHLVKPDIAAPGVDTLAAQAGSPGGIHYTEKSGTSMASPHVAGAAALVREAHPGWSAAQVKDALTSSVKADASGTVYEQGAGELWVPGAIAATITSEASVEVASFDWPHGKDEVTTHAVTYANTSDQDVTLQLSVPEVVGADGEPIAAPLISPRGNTVVVPAQGTATADLRVRGSVGRLRRSAYGEIGARVVATGATADGPLQVTTAVGMWLEPEMVDVTFRAVDRNGDPATSGLLDLTDLHQPSRQGLSFIGEDTTMRLRAGSHLVTAFIRTTEESGTSYAYVGDPEAVFTKDSTMVLDARDAEEVTVTGDRPVAIRSGTLGLHRSWDRWQVQSSVATRDSRLFVAPTPGAGDGEFSFGTYLRAGEPDAVDGQDDYVYNLAFVETDRVSGDQSHHVGDRDLAEVTEHWHAQMDGWNASDTTRVVPGNGLDPFSTSGLDPVRTPTTRTAYYTPDLAWQQLATSSLLRGELWLDPVRVHDAGDRREVDWFKLPTNTAMAVQADGSPARIGERQGTLVGFDFPSWQDTEPGRVGLAGFRDVGFLDVWSDGEHVGTSVFPRGIADVGPGQHDIEVQVAQLRTARQDTWGIGRGTVSRFAFTSPEPDGDEILPLPLALPRYDAPVDSLNRAPADADFPVDVTFTGQQGYDPGELASFTAQVTFEEIDIFASTQPEDYPWVDVPVVHEDGHWTVLVDNSGQSGTTASVRITALDANGSSTEQFVIDLYSVE